MPFTIRVLRKTILKEEAHITTTEAATILRQCLGLSAEDIEGMSVADIAEELDTLVVSNEDIWRALNAKLSVPTSTTEDTEGIQVRELR